jgi:hypothetical protein
MAQGMSIVQVLRVAARVNGTLVNVGDFGILAAN